jgi:hypothetical protein
VTATRTNVIGLLIAQGEANLASGGGCRLADTSQPDELFDSLGELVDGQQALDGSTPGFAQLPPLFRVLQEVLDGAAERGWVLRWNIESCRLEPKSTCFGEVAQEAARPLSE